MMNGRKKAPMKRTRSAVKPERGPAKPRTSPSRAKLEATAPTKSPTRKAPAKKSAMPERGPRGPAKPERGPAKPRTGPSPSPSRAKKIAADNKPAPKAFTRGKRSYAEGGSVRGTGAATSGTKFSGTF